MSKIDIINNHDIESNIWEDLVVAILAVNQYKLQKTYSQIPSLREVGIFNPNNLKKWNIEEIAERLRLGNCNRGEFMTNLFAKRLSALGELLKHREIHECEQILLSGDKESITELLMPVKGVGKKVLQNFFLLRQLNE